MAGGEQGTPIPPACSTMGQTSSLGQGWGRCPFQLGTHRPLSCPHHPKVPLKPPQSQLSWEGEQRGAARWGAHRLVAWLSTACPRGAVAWGERPWQGCGGVGRGGMRHPKKFSSQYSTLIRPDLQKNGIPGASRGPAAWLNPLPLCQELRLGMGAGGWHHVGTEGGTTVAMSILILPILPRLRSVLPRGSAGPVPHSMGTKWP